MKRFMKKGTLNFKNPTIEMIYLKKSLKCSQRTCKALTIIYLVLRSIVALFALYGSITRDKSDQNMKTFHFMLYMSILTFGAFLINFFLARYMFFKNLRGTILILTLLIECAETSYHIQTEFLPIK